MGEKEKRDRSLGLLLFRLGGVCNGQTMDGSDGRRGIAVSIFFFFFSQARPG